MSTALSPSLSLKTRLDAALAYLEEYPEIPAVLTGGTGYGEEISEADACMTGSPPGVWTRID